jgi:hypothetical protein
VTQACSNLDCVFVNIVGFSWPASLRSIVGKGACRFRYRLEGIWIAAGRPERGGSRFSLEAGRAERDLIATLCHDPSNR